MHVQSSEPRDIGKPSQDEEEGVRCYINNMETSSVEEEEEGDNKNTCDSNSPPTVEQAGRSEEGDENINNTTSDQVDLKKSDRPPKPVKQVPVTSVTSAMRRRDVQQPKLLTVATAGAISERSASRGNFQSLTKEEQKERECEGRGGERRVASVGNSSTEAFAKSRVENKKAKDVSRVSSPRSHVANIIQRMETQNHPGTTTKSTYLAASTRPGPNQVSVSSDPPTFHSVTSRLKMPPKPKFLSNANPTVAKTTNFSSDSSPQQSIVVSHLPVLPTLQSLENTGGAQGNTSHTTAGINRAQGTVQVSTSSSRTERRDSDVESVAAPGVRAVMGSKSPSFLPVRTRPGSEVVTLHNGRTKSSVPLTGTKPHKSSSSSRVLGSSNNSHTEELLRHLQLAASTCDYYGLLGVAAEATADELARAWREKSRKLHPDHYGNDPEKRACTAYFVVSTQAGVEGLPASLPSHFKMISS